MGNSVQPEPSAGEKRSKGKNVARWVSGFFIAFLAFAPPGTMILVALILSQFVGDNWFLVGGLLIIAIGVSVFLLIRNKTRNA